MKKVLSFVLVLAMILGSVSMAFAFTDDAAITNKEAAAVLNAAGIIEGYTDGSFKASGILTRAEGAAIAARLVLGKSDAAKLTTVVAPFNDVPATHWAAGYISYCASQGYLNGYGNGNFGPEDTLTVAQFGKMMLTLLGYKSENEGFIGDAWETNVGSVMVKAGLTDGVTISGSNACAREVAAQVALNTLKGGLVEYDGTPTTVSTGTVTVTTGQSAAKAAKWQSGDKGYGGANKSYLNEDSTNANVRFMERYQKKLSYTQPNDDAFGRPTTYKWFYDGEKAYTKTDKDDLAATYTTKQTQKTLYKLLNDRDAKSYEVEVAFNTAKSTFTTTYSGIEAAGIKNSTDTWADARVGNGTQIEVYVNTTGKKVTIVAYDYYLAKVAADYNASKENVSVEVKSTGAAVSGVTKISKDDVKNITELKEDDYIIFTYAGGKVKSVALATKATGDVSSYTSDKNITVDGTQYTKSVSFKGEAFADISTGYTITLILDPNNFVMATTDETAKNQYVYIYKAAVDGNLDSEYKATAFFTDGSKQTITLDAKEDWNLVSAAGLTNTNVGWFNYSVKKNGNYKLSVTNKATNPTGAAAGVSSGSINYVTGVANPANAETVFIVKKADKSTASVYTGYKKVPGTNSSVTYAAVTKDANASGVAKYVFIEASGTLTGADTSDYLVVLKGGSFSTVKSGDDTYKTYADAMLNGNEGTVQFNETPNAALTVATSGMFYDLSYDEDGRVDNGSPVTGYMNGFDYYGTVTKSAVSYSAGVLNVGNYARGVDDNVKVFVYDGELNTPSANNVKAALDEDLTFKVYVKYTTTDSATNKQIIEAIYFIKY